MGTAERWQWVGGDGSGHIEIMEWGGGDPARPCEWAGGDSGSGQVGILRVGRWGLWAGGDPGSGEVGTLGVGRWGSWEWGGGAHLQEPGSGHGRDPGSGEVGTVSGQVGTLGVGRWGPWEWAGGVLLFFLFLFFSLFEPRRTCTLERRNVYFVANVAICIFW